MSARSSDDRRVAEIWETIQTVRRRIDQGLYTEKVVTNPTNETESSLGESLAYALQRIGEEISGLSFDARASIPGDQFVGVRNILSHDYPGISWDQIWDTAIHDLEPISVYCETYARRRGCGIQQLVDDNHLRLLSEDSKRKHVRVHRWDDER